MMTATLSIVLQQITTVSNLRKPRIQGVPERATQNLICISNQLSRKVQRNIQVPRKAFLNLWKFKIPFMSNRDLPLNPMLLCGTYDQCFYLPKPHLLIQSVLSTEIPFYRDDLQSENTVTYSLNFLKWNTLYILIFPYNPSVYAHYFYEYVALRRSKAKPSNFVETRNVMFFWDTLCILTLSYP